MTAVAVDDDLNMHGLLASLLDLLESDVELVGTATTVQEGVCVIKEKKPDLLFLDIDLPDGTGFDLLDLVNAADYLIVFISGHGQYGRAALDFQALIYIDKPLRASHLREALARAHHHFDLISAAQRGKDIEIAADNFRTGSLSKVHRMTNRDGDHFIPVEDILYFTSSDDEVTVYWKGGDPISKSGRLKRMVERYELYPQFMQVNRSFLINLFEVRQITSGPSILMSNGENIPVSRQTAQEIRRRLDDM